MILNSLKSNSGVLVCVITALIITLINKYLSWKPHGMPEVFANDQYMCWKWRNILISLFHSVIISFCVLFAILIEPSLALNMISSYSYFSYLVLCLSNGYFIYDLIQSLNNIKYPGRYEIIIHHILTISGLTVSIVTKSFIGYCISALLVEISNIFLHIRQLFHMYDIDLNCRVYRINSSITIISLIVCRLFPLCWTMFCLYIDKDLMSFAYFYLALLCIIGIIVFSIIILFTVLMKDFIMPKNRH